MKILHLLYNSLPDKTGSSTRSHNILVAQQKMGYDVIAVSSPFQKGINKDLDYFENIKYFRYSSNRYRRLTISEDDKSYIQKFQKIITIFNFVNHCYKISFSYGIDVIHAHSTFYCGISGYFLSKILKKPFIYEVRSLWEERKLLQNSSWKKRLEVRIIKFIERFCMKKANKIVCINDRLKTHIINSYGINERKIYVIKNGVDAEWIDKQLAYIDNLKFRTKLNFGYVGSLSPIEGLEDLIELFNTDLKNYKLNIYGSGAKDYITSLRKKIVTDNIQIHDPIQREEIYLAYREIDVIVIPRKPSLITNTVTPLKPLEGAGMKKIVVATALEPMKELIEDGLTGFIYDPNPINLKETLQSIIKKYSNEEDFKNFTDKARQKVVSDFNWNNYHENYKGLYSF